MESEKRISFEEKTFDKEKVSQAIKSALAKKQGPLTSKNLVLSFLINDQVFYAKEIKSYDESLEKTNPALSDLEKVEDGITQVICHRLLNTVLGDQQPLSFLYQDEERIWLIIPEVKYDTNFSKFFAEALERKALLENLKKQIRYLPEFWDKEGLVDPDFIHEIFVGKEKCLDKDTLLNTSDLVKEAVRKKDKGLLASAINLIDKVMHESQIQLSKLVIRNVSNDGKQSDIPFDLKTFVKLLVVMLLLAESDANFNNIVLIKSASGTGTTNSNVGDKTVYLPIMFDIDLILGKLNNFVLRMAAKKQSFNLSPEDFTLQGLIQPQAHRPKLWLDSIINYENSTSILSLNGLTETQLNEWVAEVLKTIKEVLNALSLDSIHGHIFLLNDTEQNNLTAILNHVSKCKEYIAQRTAYVARNMVYDEAKFQTATESYLLEEIQPFCEQFEESLDFIRDEFEKTGGKYESGLFKRYDYRNDFFQKFFAIINDSKKKWPDRIKQFKALLIEFNDYQNKPDFTEMHQALATMAGNLKQLQEKNLLPEAQEQLKNIIAGSSMGIKRSSKH